MKKKFFWLKILASGFFLGFLFFNVNLARAAQGYCLCRAGDTCIFINNYTGAASTDCNQICASKSTDSPQVFATKEECDKVTGNDRKRYCLCTNDFTSGKYRVYADVKNSGCLLFDPIVDSSFCSKAARGAYDVCNTYYGNNECQNDLTTWQTNFQAFRNKETSAGIGAFMPACALEDSLTPACRDVGIFVNLLINVGKYLFSIVGALALLVMVIAGFQLVTSQGNSEKVKKGFQMMLGAGIGLAIVFGAYVLVGYLAILMGVDASLNLF